jgi:hypothetical protein
MRSKIVGTWKLISFEMRYSDGSVFYPWGAGASGQLIYTADGFMSVVFMRDQRPSFVNQDVMMATPAECEAALKTLMSYAGTYDFQGERVIHHAQFCTFPNWTGTAIERFVALEEGRLTLSSAFMPFLGKQAAAVLVWERAAV